ncbi:MAG: adenylosuccinate lyase, partial [Ilumatobacter sp.]
MIPRYSTPAMDAVWSDTSKFARWLEVELLATEGHAELGVVPKEAAEICRAKAPVADDAFLQRILDREQITDHDVAAFVDITQESIDDPAGSW